MYKNGFPEFFFFFLLRSFGVCLFTWLYYGFFVVLECVDLLWGGDVCVKQQIIEIKLKIISK